MTLLRAAAKNHIRVSVLSDPNDYERFLKEWVDGKGGLEGEKGEKLRKELALKAFEMTAEYDGAISDYFRKEYASGDLPVEKRAGPVQRLSLRYGANPHQKPAQAFVTHGALPFEGTASIISLLSVTIPFFPLTRHLIFHLDSPLRFPGLHQPPRRPKLLRPRLRTSRSSSPARSRVLQTRLTRRSGCRVTTHRDGEKSVWSRRFEGGVEWVGLCLCEGERYGVFLSLPPFSDDSNLGWN